MYTLLSSMTIAEQMEACDQIADHTQKQKVRVDAAKLLLENLMTEEYDFHDKHPMLQTHEWLNFGSYVYDMLRTVQGAADMYAEQYATFGSIYRQKFAEVIREDR